MLKLGKLELGDSAKIAATISDVRPETIKRVKRDGAQIVELRLDEFRKIDARSVRRILKFAKTAGLPIIATIRSKKEGGRKFISHQKRLQLFRMIILEVDSIDIELSSRIILDSVIELAHKSHKLVIVSYHNFVQTPSGEKLEKIIKEAKSRRADIVKISTLAKTPDDILTLGRITFKNKTKNIITLAMGKIGAVSRIFLPAMGSLVTYGFVDKPHAPGQLSVKVLKRDLKAYCAKRPPRMGRIK